MILRCYRNSGHRVYGPTRTVVVCDACGAIPLPGDINNTGGLPAHDYEVAYVACYGMGAWYGFATRDAAEAWLGNRNGCVTPVALVDPAEVKAPA